MPRKRNNQTWKLDNGEGPAPHNPCKDYFDDYINTTTIRPPWYKYSAPRSSKTTIKDDMDCVGANPNIAGGTKIDINGKPCGTIPQNKDININNIKNIKNKKKKNKKLNNIKKKLKKNKKKKQNKNKVKNGDIIPIGDGPDGATKDKPKKITIKKVGVIKPPKITSSGVPHGTKKRKRKYLFGKNISYFMK